MEEGPLRWAPPEEVVRLAKEAGMSTTEIVRIVSGYLSYSEALEVAREYSPLLEITVSEFTKLSRMNNSQSNGFEPRDHILAVAATAQCRVIDFALFPMKFVFNCLQQSVARFQARFGVIFLLSGRRIHRKRIPRHRTLFNPFRWAAPLLRVHLTVQEFNVFPTQWK
jgi:DNA-binding XRE family transcriptional regulator